MGRIRFLEASWRAERRDRSDAAPGALRNQYAASGDAKIPSESRSRSRTTAAVPLLLTNGKMLQNCSFQKFQDPKAMQQRCAGRDFAQARQEGEEAHAAGLPLLGSVYAAFLPMQGVRAAPAPRRPRA